MTHMKGMDRVFGRVAEPDGSSGGGWAESITLQPSGPRQVLQAERVELDGPKQMDRAELATQRALGRVSRAGWIESSWVGRVNQAVA